MSFLGGKESKEDKSIKEAGENVEQRSYVVDEANDGVRIDKYLALLMEEWLKILYTENNWRSVGVCKRKSG